MLYSEPHLLLKHAALCFTFFISSHKHFSFDLYTMAVTLVILAECLSKDLNKEKPSGFLFFFPLSDSFHPCIHPSHFFRVYSYLEFQRQESVRGYSYITSSLHLPLSTSVCRPGFEAYANRYPHTVWRLFSVLS